MAYCEYPDGNGDTIRLYEDDGRIFCIPSPIWHNMTQMTSREDDVLVCSYCKSGTHWTWEIVRMLMTGNTDMTSADMKSHLLLFAGDADKMANPRVLATHRQFQDLPTDVIAKKRKLVIVLREPKDVCVSFYHNMINANIVNYKGTFDGFVSLFLGGKVPMNSWSRWVLSYEKGLREHPELSYHVIHYEKLKKDPVGEIGRLAEYLGASPSLVAQVAEKTRFDVMQKEKFKADDPFGFIFKGNQSNGHIFRKGEGGGWKEWFSEEQAAHFDTSISQQLGRPSPLPLL